MSEKEKSQGDNFTINKDENWIQVSVNPRIFMIPTIIQAVNDFSNRGYVCVDGDPSERIVVKIIPFEKDTDLEKLAYEFNTTLVTAFVHKDTIPR